MVDRKYINNKNNICVLYGGVSSERNVSISTAKAVINSIKDQSILLHELVHHFQYYWDATKYKKMCSGHVEREAYDIHRKWLEEKGHNLFATINMNDLTLSLITSCTYYY